MYTDGLNEARNAFGTEFGDTKVRSLVELYGSLDASTMAKKIQSSLEQFIGDVKPGDDITFSCIKKGPDSQVPVRTSDYVQDVESM